MKKVIMLLGITFFLTGCANAVNDSSFSDVELEKTTEGVSYKKFQIENCTFIGTQDEEEVWHYAGPISCAKQVSPGKQY
jgi:uncharacterized lipoprotein NlpE involved in copper resistance